MVAGLALVSLSAGAQNLYLEDFLSSTFKFETALEPAATGAFSNWVTRPAGFGSGWSGYGYHYGVGIADGVNGKFMRRFAFAGLSRHRDEFDPFTSGGKWKRLGLAVEHSVFADLEKKSL